VVQVVAEDAEGEDGYGEGIAAETRVAPEELGYDFVVVFWGLLEELWNGPGAVIAGAVCMPEVSYLVAQRYYRRQLAMSLKNTLKSLTSRT